jgi:uncharacterized repeat protein (TIGR01451 family)
MVKYEHGKCVTPPPPPPVDVCPNIEAVQTGVPTGLVKDTNGNCVAPPPTPTVNPPPNPPAGPVDVCPNLAGVQETVPAGLVKIANGGCAPAAPPAVDVGITKTLTPTTVSVGGTMTYVMRITNSGPDVATGVTVTDNVPAGTTFVSVAPSQGSCTGTSAIRCDLGTVAVGGSAQIVLIVIGRTPGTVANSAEVTSLETDTNLSNNRASVPGRVTGPFRPPAVVRCTSLTIGPKVVRVGKVARVVVRLAASGKPFGNARIVYTGAGTSGSARTNVAGRVALRIAPMRPGVIHVTTPGSPRCAGVLGATKGPSEAKLTG